MSDQFKEGFANIAARKLAKDQAAHDAEAAKARAAREAEAQWVADKVSFQAHQRIVTDIIADHAETLRAAGLSLRSNASNFDERNRSGSISVYAVTGGTGGTNSISFNLRNGNVTPMLAQEGGRASPDAVSIRDANRAFYEGAILRMLEIAYPPAR